MCPNIFKLWPNLDRADQVVGQLYSSASVIYTTRCDLIDLMSDVADCALTETYFVTHSGRKKTVICGVYRPPKLPIYRFREQLQLFLEEV